jgi:uncharacterized flavoprotein (TIGR03862 family)
MALKKVQALIIGAGPAGLMAAEVLGAAGAQVTVADAKPSVARKFLMAGKSGLNLTKDEPLNQFLDAYPEGRAWLKPMLTAFGPAQVSEWATDLGQGLFTGSTGRVFPEKMKASPLLRAWMGRLDDYGVQVQTRWRWVGWDGTACRFITPEGEERVEADVTILALGGGSWARLGSDGMWAGMLAASGVPVAPLQPSNAGLRVNWSQFMDRYYGTPLKGVALSAGELTSRGEVVISRRGIEGGGIYPLSSALRSGAGLTIDLLPDVPIVALTARLSRHRGKTSLRDHLRKSARLGPLPIALAQEFARPLPSDPAKLAKLVKALPITHAGLRPIDEAISTAGGVMQSGVDDGLMLTSRPGCYVSGEMLDWDAPTGGYLLTACFASGRWAGHAAARRLKLVT